MALIKPAASGEARRALIAGLADFADPADRRTDDLKAAPIGLHVFTLGLRDIVNGGGVKDAKPAGWRFLAGDPLGDVSAGDVIEPLPGAPQGAAAKMTSLSHDPIIRRAIRAVHEVETLPEVRDNDFELLILRIPGLLIEAFWLRSPKPGADLIVPVLTRARELQRKKAYPEAEFMAIIRPMTTKFLEFDKEPN